MTGYLHTMYRITDPEKSRAFYEALGFEFRREFPIVRDGELEATNFLFGFPGQQEELELTFNHDGRSYELGTGYGRIAIGGADLGLTLSRLLGAVGRRRDRGAQQPPSAYQPDAQHAAVGDGRQLRGPRQIVEAWPYAPARRTEVRL